MALAFTQYMLACWRKCRISEKCWLLRPGKKGILKAKYVLRQRIPLLPTVMSKEIICMPANDHTLKKEIFFLFHLQYI